MIIKRTKIVDNGSVASAVSVRARASTLMKQIMNIKNEMKNKNKLSEENNHACF